MSITAEDINRDGNAPLLEMARGGYAEYMPMGSWPTKDIARPMHPVTFCRGLYGAWVEVWRVSDSGEEFRRVELGGEFWWEPQAVHS